MTEIDLTDTAADTDSDTADSDSARAETTLACPRCGGVVVAHTDEELRYSCTDCKCIWAGRSIKMFNADS